DLELSAVDERFEFFGDRFEDRRALVGVFLRLAQVVELGPRRGEVRVRVARGLLARFARILLRVAVLFAGVELAAQIGLTLSVNDRLAALLNGVEAEGAARDEKQYGCGLRRSSGLHEPSVSRLMKGCFIGRPGSRRSS